MRYPEKTPLSPLPRYGDRRRMRIGILGGSFNPAHAGHLHIAEVALRRLRLQQVWLLVSPGNPLKDAAGMAPLAERLAAAGRIADGRRIIATDIERHLDTRFTLDTIRTLQTLFPCARFVWLMGADNMVQFPRWRGWTRIVGTTPFAVLPRPSYSAKARIGQAAHRLAGSRHPVRQASILADLPAPAWVFLDGRENPQSATALRRAMAGEFPSPENQALPRPPCPARRIPPKR